MRRGQTLGQVTEPVRPSEKGFSLVVVLFFVGLVASLITIATINQRGAAQRDKAEAAGWYLAQVAKAARIYVRDRSLLPADPYHKSKLAAAGIVVRVNDLRASGLLPPNFPANSGLGQIVRIYAANYPVNGNPNNENTIANAYVFFQETTETAQKPELMQYLLEGAKKYGLLVNAPIFSAAGNISDDCNGAPAVALWDTGCLNLAEFTKITARPTFVAGSVMVPAWRSEVHDSRAVMRFPQPENPASATMLTALEMAETVRDVDGNCNQFVQIKDYTTGRQKKTNLCNTKEDGFRGMQPPAGANRPYSDVRFDMINVSTMNVDNVIAAHQSNVVAVDETPNPVWVEMTFQEQAWRYVGKTLTVMDEYASIRDADTVDLLQDEDSQNEDGVLYVSGNLSTTGNVWATAARPLQTPANPIVKFASVNGASRSIQIDHNISVEQDMVVSGASSIGQASVATLANEGPNAVTTVAGRADAGSIDTDRLIVNNSAGSQSGMITTNMNVRRAPVIADKATLFSPLTLTGDVDIKQSTQLIDEDDPRKGSVPGLIVYRAQGAGGITTKAMKSRETLAVNGAAVVKGNTSVEECFNGSLCPDITPDPADVVIP